MDKYIDQFLSLDFQPPHWRREAAASPPPTPTNVWDSHLFFFWPHLRSNSLSSLTASDMIWPGLLQHNECKLALATPISCNSWHVIKSFADIPWPWWHTINHDYDNNNDDHVVIMLLDNYDDDDKDMTDRTRSWACSLRLRNWVSVLWSNLPRTCRHTDIHREAWQFSVQQKP